MTGHSKIRWRVCWEGTDSPFHFGETISTDLANYNGRSWDGQSGANRERTVDVGSFPPNAWGLHDVIGNVGEWTTDRCAPFPVNQDGPLVDPRGSQTDGIRVIRGGSWRTVPAECRSGASCYYMPQRRNSTNGLRLAANPTPKGTER
ncbi:MAG: formylglycine-generating enzyme family protein [Planctomycetes bacterium]|nr:formylglycine-generating enzyme family protein [Planctomycetota bacterium]MBL7044371.1 formylglycine-generating enzyme family protein [Pirellulaceae bacterium]